MTNKKLASERELSRLARMDPHRVAKLLLAGRIKPTRTKTVAGRQERMYNLNAALKELSKHTVAKDILARRSAAQAQLIHLKLALKDGRLLKAQDVLDTFDEFSMRFIDQLYKVLPGRLAPDFVTDNREMACAREKAELLELARTPFPWPKK